MRMWRMVGWLLLAAWPAVAETNLSLWQDLRPGVQPSMSLGLVTPEVELWTFGQPDYPIYEVGRLVPLGNKQHLTLAGGYLSYWSSSGDWFAEQWVTYLGDNGPISTQATVAAYLPLTGGSWVVYSQESNALYHLSRRVALGLAGTFWLQDGFGSAALGPKISWQCASDLTLTARYLFGQHESNSCQLTATWQF